MSECSDLYFLAPIAENWKKWGFSVVDEKIKTKKTLHTNEAIFQAIKEKRATNIFFKSSCLHL